MGVPQIVEIGPNGQVLVTSTNVDFGPGLLNSQIDREVLIRNDGRAAVTVSDVQRSADFSDAFKYDFKQFSIRENEQISFRVSFLPSAPGAFGGTLKLVIPDGEPSALEIKMVGMGVDGQCELSTPVLDFGSTAIGSSAPLQVKVLNKSTLSWTVTIGDLDSGRGDAAAFEFGAGFAAGAYPVPAMSAEGTPGELVVPIEFKPKRVGEYTGFLSIPAPAMCPSQVTLHGAGVEHLLQCDPTVTDNGTQVCRVDFGFVNPGAKATKQVSFKNLGTKDISLSLLDITQPPNVSDNPYAIDDGARDFTVPGNGGTADIALSFTPGTLGLQFAKLNYLSDDPNRPTGTVELMGVGGGPAIDVQPPALEFGEVAIDTYQFRRVTVANVGTDVGGTDADNLLFAAFQSGNWVEKQAEVLGADASSFTVEWPPQGYGALGLAEGQNADIRVKFSPVSEGRKEAMLNIYSNDPAQPVLQVPLSGLGANLPPCDYDIKPPTLNFGTVEPNRYVTLTFSIVNRASDPADACLVSLLDLTRATRDSGSFALVNGPLGLDTAVSVPGGGKLDVPVRFAPKQQGTYSGEIEFFVSSPTRPDVTVALNGTAAPVCLMIAPRDLDFGTIGVNCNSRQRLFTMYNTCSSSLSISAIDLQQGGASAEFTVTKKPSLPLSLAGAAQSDFGVTYHPVDIGDDTAAVAVTLATAPTPTVYMVPIAGRGATDPVQTDVFSQSDQPKVDVLLIIDNSCSMSDKQASLGRNFASFIHYAVQQKVDYHIAATTVSLDDPSYECGRFVPLTGSNPRIITPSTPNKEQVFSQNVNLGTGGTGTEALIRPGYLALTNPLINGHNAGFYRDEAKLAIVVVSDAADQDPLATPVSFYENFYLNLKGIKRRNDFTFSGVIPLQATAPDYSSGCSYDEPASGQDPRVKQLIQRTGGLQDEICNPDWSKTLEKLGTRVFGLRTTFFLSNTPDMSVTPDPIVIMVDNLPFPQYGAKGDKRWDYNSGSNAVEFDPLAVPDPGSTLSISYHVACL